MRIEKDSFGTIEVPANALWGSQTQRSLLNFSITNDLIPINLIHALAKIKHASAIANNRLGVLDKKRKELIVKAATEIVQGLHDNQFPLRVWQTGSGTHTNMNINEVISNLASKACDEPLGSYSPVHPNDHVNRSQSTNDTFPAAIHIATVEAITVKLLPEISLLINSFNQKANEWKEVIKIGRTHFQDAVPMTLAQEVSAWSEQLSIAHKRIQRAITELYPLPIGGTAIGTGLNAPKSFDKEATAEISKLTNLPFYSAMNKFAIMASHDGLVNTMSQLKMLSVSLLKIVNDIRFLSSGPRAGVAEIKLPENEPGSSIMPGKVNPTQCEAMAMICTQVIGLDTAVAMAGSGGHLQMNAYKPLIGFNILHSIELLHDACKSCRTAMVDGLEPNAKKIQGYLDKSLMLITALTPEIGYEKAAEVAHYAHKKEITLREAALELDYISSSKFDKIIDPRLMI